MNVAIANINDQRSKLVAVKNVDPDGLDQTGFKTRMHIEFFLAAPIHIRIKHPDTEISHDQSNGKT